MNNNKGYQSRVGEVNYNFYNEKMTIIQYISSRKVLVEFENGYQRWCTYGNFTSGVVKNNSVPRSYNIGICDIKDIKGDLDKEYRFWQSMLRRCYAKEWKEKHPTYQDATCSKQWLYFSNFVEWSHNQENWKFIISHKVGFNLDKDIICKHNKIYTPQLCCYVPQYVNKIFTRHEAKRGAYPIGVNYNKKGDCFEAYWGDPYEGRKSLYGFSTPEDAFEQYKINKEKVIKKVAQHELEIGTISTACYEAMMQYQVEITD